MKLTSTEAKLVAVARKLANRKPLYTVQTLWLREDTTCTHCKGNYSVEELGWTRVCTRCVRGKISGSPKEVHAVRQVTSEVYARSSISEISVEYAADPSEPTYSVNCVGLNAIYLTEAGAKRRLKVLQRQQRQHQRQRLKKQRAAAKTMASTATTAATL